MFRSVKGFSGFGQTGILLAFTGLGFILAGVAQILIMMVILPKGVPITNVEALKEAVLDPRNVEYTRLSQVLGTLFLFFIPAYLFTLVAYGKSAFWLGFNPYFKWSQVWVAFFLILVASFAFSPLSDITKNIVSHFPRLNQLARELEDAYTAQVKVLSNLKSWPEYASALVIMAFFPALFEEVFFRGVLQNLLEKWWRNPWMAIIVASIIFSIFHSSVYLFFTRVALGCLLGFIYYQTRNIWINVIAHFLNNALAVTQLFVMFKQHQNVDMDELDPHVNWWWSLPALLVIAVLLYFLKKISFPIKQKIKEKEMSLSQQKNIHNLFDSN